MISHHLFRQSYSQLEDAMLSVVGQVRYHTGKKEFGDQRIPMSLEEGDGGLCFAFTDGYLTVILYPNGRFPNGDPCFTVESRFDA